MNRFKTIVLGLILSIAFSLFSQSPAAADECFQASGSLTADGQTIRLLGQKMGWKVGKSASLSAAAIVEGKVKLYPKTGVRVCLHEEGDTLKIKAQSKSEDAGKASWHKLPARSNKSDTIESESPKKGDGSNSKGSE